MENKNGVIMRRNIFISLIILLSTTITSNMLCVLIPNDLGDSWHFNTEILKNSETTRQRLIAEDGFQPIDFHPANNNEKVLKGLFLERPDARATIIFTPGFWPGLKEPFAPFVKLAPEDCNLLFIELTNHGESSDHSCCSSAATCLTPSPCIKMPSCLDFFKGLGMPSCLDITSSSFLGCSSCKALRFMCSLKKYGTEEYLDVIGAIQHISEKTNRKPIILFGWCSGAFHSAQTLIKLKQIGQEQGQDLIKQFNIQGLIFDSGFGSLTDMIEGSYHHINNLIIPEYMKNGEETSGPLGMLKRGFDYVKIGVTNVILKALEVWVRPSLEKNLPETNLYDNIHKLGNLPIFVIHCENDDLSTWEKVRQLVNNMQNKELWLIPESTHAKNHLKHKEEYFAQMRSWINQVLANIPVKNEIPNGQIVQEMIRIIDTIIGHMENETENSEQEAQALFMRFMELLNNPIYNIPQETREQIQEKIANLIAAENNTTEAKRILNEIKEVLEKLNQNISTQPDSNASTSTTTNPQKHAPNNPISIRMIRILDELMREDQSSTSLEEAERLAQQFETLLDHPANNISPEDKERIRTIINNLKNTRTMDQKTIKEHLTEMRRILDPQGKIKLLKSNNNVESNQTNSLLNEKPTTQNQRTRSSRKTYNQTPIYSILYFASCYGYPVLPSCIVYDMVISCLNSLIS